MTQQTTLFNFYEGHRTEVIENHPIQRRVYDYINKQYHKGHRYLFVFRYEGPQPIRSADAVGSWGRYGTVKQARFNYSEDKAIVFSLPHALKIWIKHPDGSRTAEELAAAHKTAWEVAESFSRKHGIQILNEKPPNFSEHTVENKPLDNLMRPMVQEEPELAKKKLGLSINQTSHKNKVEWTGRTAKERVMALEKLLDTNVLEKIETIEQGVGALSEGQDRIIRRLARTRKLKAAEPIKPIDDSDKWMFR